MEMALLAEAREVLGLAVVDPMVVDTRGEEPPQPFVLILEAFNGLAEGAVLVAMTDRRPMMLLAHLEEVGATYSCERGTDGSTITYIRRG